MFECHVHPCKDSPFVVKEHQNQGRVRLPLHASMGFDITEPKLRCVTYSWTKTAGFTSVLRLRLNTPKESRPNGCPDGEDLHNVALSHSILLPFQLAGVRRVGC